MATLKLTGFSGEIPKIIPRLLPDMSATECFNVRLDDGGLTPIRKSFQTHFFDPDPGEDGTIYRHDGEWMSWPGFVHVVPGPVATDRLYITGDGLPKMRVAGTDYDLKIIPPNAKLNAVVSGTPDPDADQVTRLYAYTFVTQFGEESEPSPISDEVEWTPGETVTLSGFSEGDSARGVTLQRIYRSQSGQTGTDLFLIAERSTSTTDFVDNVPPEDIQEILPSVTWTPPVDTLEGIISLPNGMMAAFSGKDLYFCEPYIPHAWPEIYSLTTDYEIVGLGAGGTSMVVMTTGSPYLVTGSSPEAMIMERLELNLPCLNARGIVDMGYGIAYPSHDGLVLASLDGVRIVSGSLFSRDGWLELDPATFASGNYDGRYIASYSYLDASGQRKSGSIIVDLTGEQSFLIRTSTYTKSFYYEIQSGSLFYLSVGNVYQWDSLLATNAVQSWRSKEFVLPRPTNFGAILIEAKGDLTPEEEMALEEEFEEVKEHNETVFNGPEELGGEIDGRAINVYTINGDALLPLPASARTVSVNIYADGDLVASVTRFNSMARLPSGFRARRWQFEVTGDMPVEQITLATTGAELMRV